MGEPTLQERVATLERTVAELVTLQSVNRSDWRSTFGMFTEDPVMKEIQEEGRKVREADRLATKVEEDRQS